MNWLVRLLPSRAAIVATCAAALATLIALARRDARRTTETKAELKDLHHAEEIADRVADDRADPDRLRPYDRAGWRD